MGQDIEDAEIGVTEDAPLNLTTSVLLSFAAEVLTTRPLRQACSIDAFHTLCLDTTTRPRDAFCVYCALAQARVWYTLMTGTPSAAMAEALTLANSDAEAIYLHDKPSISTQYHRAALIKNLARTRLRAATGAAH